jgi:hypothetical protein
MIDWPALTKALKGADVTVHAEVRHEGVVVSTFSSETLSGDGFAGMILAPDKEGPDTVQTNVWVPYSQIAAVEIYV